MKMPFAEWEINWNVSGQLSRFWGFLQSLKDFLVSQKSSISSTSCLPTCSPHPLRITTTRKENIFTSRKLFCDVHAIRNQKQQKQSVSRSLSPATVVHAFRHAKIFGIVNGIREGNRDWLTQFYKRTFINYWCKISVDSAGRISKILCCEFFLWCQDSSLTSAALIFA